MLLNFYLLSQRQNARSSDVRHEMKKQQCATMDGQQQHNVLLCYTILFLHPLKPYNIMMGDYNDDIWSSDPTRPWQQDLANGVLLDPLHASSQPPEPRRYCTHIPRHGRPRRLGAILIRQQIPNIPWTYYDTIQMPILDHALVLLGIRWRIGAPNPPYRKPQPSVSKWYTTHF